jgi:hypothetical protein
MERSTRYPLLRRENVPAYVTVMAVWVGVSLVSAAALKVTVAPTLTWRLASIWALATTMAGMAIMFVASALNLRKLRAGFDRLSRGDTDPGIPRVWCPVLTMATEAAVELRRALQERDAVPRGPGTTTR